MNNKRFRQIFIYLMLIAIVASLILSSLIPLLAN
ncbi:stressosome-associated protein Prli42 [Macrococcus equipercicus]|uniref:Stressosome-associated protein Prli42 n=1 Tax=Macrococcus equipercicus TaxID=69967 RepID=A0A9Q9BS40_9STAP|nr:stressosome-associated protein Prli42 [Macrococcus equipercicus]KAA1040146.1 stressosome-associated protein Prli42 [Macrococcus equipercicus]UTH12906.1 stressosome-associated protein Prli42 [Macrococcus equipercicus]